MQLTVELNDDQSQRLLARAKELSMQPEELVGVAVDDWLSDADSDFQRIIDRIVDKNRELYKRLS